MITPEQAGTKPADSIAAIREAVQLLHDKGLHIEAVALGVHAERLEAVLKPSPEPAVAEPPIDIERIIALVDDYADHFADVTAAERQTPNLADAIVLKAKKDRIRAALKATP